MMPSLLYMNRKFLWKINDKLYIRKTNGNRFLSTFKSNDNIRQILSRHFQDFSNWPPKQNGRLRIAAGRKEGLNKRKPKSKKWVKKTQNNKLVNRLFLSDLFFSLSMNCYITLPSLRNLELTKRYTLFVQV